MNVLRSLLQGWVKLRDAARNELLRDPNVILFERRPEQAPDLAGQGGRAA